MIDPLRFCSSLREVSDQSIQSGVHSQFQILQPPLRRTAIKGSGGSHVRNLSETSGLLLFPLWTRWWERQPSRHVCPRVEYDQRQSVSVDLAVGLFHHIHRNDTSRDPRVTGVLRQCQTFPHEDQNAPFL